MSVLVRLVIVLVCEIFGGGREFRLFLRGYEGFSKLFGVFQLFSFCYCLGRNTIWRVIVRIRGRLQVRFFRQVSKVSVQIIVFYLFCWKVLVLGSFLGWGWFRCIRFVGLVFAGRSRQDFFGFILVIFLRNLGLLGFWLF